MKKVNKIENLFFELLFFERGYLIYYSNYMDELLGSHSKHSD